LIRINDNLIRAGRRSRRLKGDFLMPFDSMVMSAVVLVIFIVFAGVIAWADYQTRPERLKKR
jgi:hypothetical protein